MVRVVNWKGRLMVLFSAKPLCMIGKQGACVLLFQLCVRSPESGQENCIHSDKAVVPVRKHGRY